MLQPAFLYKITMRNSGSSSSTARYLQKKAKHVTLPVEGIGSGTGNPETNIFSQSVTSADLTISDYSDAAVGTGSRPNEKFQQVRSKSREVFSYDDKMSQTDNLSEDSDELTHKTCWKRKKKDFDVKGACVGIGMTQMLAASIHIFVRSVMVLYHQMHKLRLLDILDYTTFSVMLVAGAILLCSAYQMQEWLALVHSLASIILTAALTCIVVFYNTKNAISESDPLSEMSVTNTVLYSMEAMVQVPFAICSSALYCFLVTARRQKKKEGEKDFVLTNWN